MTRPSVRGEPSRLMVWAVAVLAAVAVPFAIAGASRFEDDGEVIVIGCVVLGAALLACRGLLRAAAVGWLVGCALYVTLVVWVLAGLD